MLISLNFVNRFLELAKKEGRFDLDFLAPALTQQGFEVESITHRGDGFEKVVVGLIKEAVKHPNADKLQVCQVDLGNGKIQQIVCGAPNARVGLYVAAALPGASLPGGLNIKESKIRDVESKGMLCSRAELGLPVNDVDGSGIWELNEDEQGGVTSELLSVQLGNPVYDALHLRDVLLELNVTPNRPDMLCHLGAAREIAVALEYAGKPVLWKNFGFEHFSKMTAPAIVKGVYENSSIKCGDVTFSSENSLGVSAFFVVAEGVTATPSPAWLRNLLESLGQNSINNIVDMSNFVLLGYGQPSHAFDLDKLARNGSNVKLNLRLASQGESFIGLDAKERTLDKSDCVVADTQKPQALLGVIGGNDSKVDLNTKRIVIEFANADPVAVRRTSRRIGRSTDSSFAFEKGISVAHRFNAACEFLGLLEKLSPGYKVLGAVHSEECEATPVAKTAVSAPQSFAFPKRAVNFDYAFTLPEPAGIPAKEWEKHSAEIRKKRTIVFHESDQEKFLGASITAFSNQIKILKSLGFSVESKIAQSAEAHVPTWRWIDIETPACLVDEVVRVVGIDHVPATPLLQKGEPGKDDVHFAFIEKVANKAAALGYLEIAGLHFMKLEDCTSLNLPSSSALGEPLILLNPIIRDEPAMQTTLIPDLLRKVARNLSFGTKSGQLCHVSRTFQNADALGNRLFKDNGQYLGLDKSLGQVPKNLYDYSPQFSLSYTSDSEGRPTETPRIAGVVFGNQEEKSWNNTAAKPWSFHALCAHVLEICRASGVEVQMQMLPDEHPMASGLHPGMRVGFYIGTDKCIGWAGALVPKALRAFEIEAQLFAFELNLALLLKTSLEAKVTKKRVIAARKFPSITRDFAFLLKDEILASQLNETVKKSLKPVLGSHVPATLLSFNVFDVYRGKGVGEGEKSVAFSVTLEPTERTLTEADIQKITSAVVELVTSELKGDLRG